MIYITSQRERIEDIVSEKIEAKDFTVSYMDLGNGMRMVVDGHHSHQAAVDAGVEPEYVESDIAHGLEQELQYLGLELFLEANFMDSAWYDINTGIEVF